MSTKKRILESALKLYNRLGVDKVTARHIAADCGISDGNLRYHFKDREAIIMELYLNLVASLDQEFTPEQGLKADLKTLYYTMHFTYSQLFTYKFLMLDFVSIMRRIPQIKAHYTQLQKQRYQQYNLLVEMLLKAGILKEEVIPGQYDSLMDLLQILSDFWISSSEILHEGSDAEKIMYYTRKIFTIIIPYLSSTGMEELKDLMKDEADW